MSDLDTSTDYSKKFEPFPLIGTQHQTDSPCDQKQELQLGPSNSAATVSGGDVDAVEHDEKLNYAATFGDEYPELLDATCVPVTTTEDCMLGDDIETGNGTFDDDGLKGSRKKRLCRFPGCDRVIKSQGHCQRHGARAKRCRVAGCDKQAQGTHDGMCKRHWRDMNCPQSLKANEKEPPIPEGESVYDTILPNSVAFRPTNLNDNSNNSNSKRKPARKETKKMTSNAGVAGVTDDDDDDDKEPPEPPKNTNVMPLVRFLCEGRSKQPGWHRAEERRARGLFAVPSNGHQLEPWEKQLALVEILLLAGGTPYANFRHLGHAWGREKGFHLVLANSVFERRGDIDRKRRSDAGKALSDEKKAIIREKTVLSRVIGDTGVVIITGIEKPVKSVKKEPGHVSSNKRRRGTTAESVEDELINDSVTAETTVMTDELNPSSTNACSVVNATFRSEDMADANSSIPILNSIDEVDATAVTTTLEEYSFTALVETQQLPCTETIEETHGTTLGVGYDSAGFMNAAV